MLTTLIYRSRLCEFVPFQDIENMVVRANIRNEHENVTGILLFNGRHFFQLLEGPESSVKMLYEEICTDKRHHNVVQLLCDYAPSRRYGKAGMELFDLRKHDEDSVLQAVLDKGTSRFKLTYNDRALQFFRTFVTTTGKESYYEIPPVDSWSFQLADQEESYALLPHEHGQGFTLQPVVDPLARRVLAVEFRKERSQLPADALRSSAENLYSDDLMDKEKIFQIASHFLSRYTLLTISLMPMTLVRIPGAVEFLLKAIRACNLIPEQIVVQFSEQEIVSQLDEFTDAVKALKASGISVAIDNFGAGFACLQLLAQFQPDRIKINRHLIADVHNSDPRQAIIHAIIQCCSSLEIQISGDGIEKAEEWMWLESAGIEHFQGPLFSRPERGKMPSVTWPEKKRDEVA